MTIAECDKLGSKYGIDAETLADICKRHGVLEILGNPRYNKAMAKILKKELITISVAFRTNDSDINIKKLLKDNDITFTRILGTKKGCQFYIELKIPREYWTEKKSSHAVRFYIYDSDIEDWLNNDISFFDTMKENCSNKTKERYMHMQYNDVNELPQRIAELVELIDKNNKDIELDNDANEIEDDLDL